MYPTVPMAPAHFVWWHPLRRLHFCSAVPLGLLLGVAPSAYTPNFWKAPLPGDRFLFGLRTCVRCRHQFFFGGVFGTLLFLWAAPSPPAPILDGAFRARCTFWRRLWRHLQQMWRCFRQRLPLLSATSLALDPIMGAPPSPLPPPKWAVRSALASMSCTTPLAMAHKLSGGSFSAIRFSDDRRTQIYFLRHVWYRQ